MKTLFGYGAVMALAMTATACSKSADSPSTLEVTGKVDTQLRTLDNASAIAIASDGHTYAAYLQKNGAFHLSLPAGKVYRILFANSTAKGEHRTIGHLVNATSNGKFDEIAVKDGGTMNLGVVRPVGTSASALHTACKCDSPGSSSGGGAEKSGGADKGGSSSGGADSSCHCSKECGAGSSCVASKCAPDAAPSGGSSGTGAGTSSSSGSVPPTK